MLQAVTQGFFGINFEITEVIILKNSVHTWIDCFKYVCILYICFSVNMNVFGILGARSA